jgi:integrase
VQHGPNSRGVLTQEKADEIRQRCTFGEQQKLVAQAFNVSATIVSQIINGRIWNPEKYRVGTKGTEMERRLIGAFDGGLRAGEMSLVQIKHVDWRGVMITDAHGTQIPCYLLKLPPSVTKGGKTSGKVETIYVATERFRRMLDRRRMQLKNNPEAYIFGTEAGHRQGSFKKLWHALFTLAGIDYGRDIGVVWHTIRHEYISRIAELTADPQVVQELARHRDFDTTQLYLKAREQKKILAVAGLCRG